MDSKKQRLLLLFLLLIIAIFSVWGVFLLQGNDKESGDEVKSDVAKKINYPRRLKGDPISPGVDAAAAFSIYYGENNEKVLYEENADKILPIASISKIMTALVVLENYKLEEEMMVAEYDVTSRTEFRDFRAWPQTTVGDIIYPMLIESNNSGAFALALISDRFLDTENEPVEGFVSKMNEKANSLGLEKTTFINPSGLDGKEKYNNSSAREIAIFAKHIIENKPKIFEILEMPSYRLYSPDRMAYYDAINTNAFLRDDEEEWQEHIIGGKTGWTRAAFGCLLIVLEAPDKKGYIVNVILGAEDRFKEMRKLINFVYDSYVF